MDEPWQVYYEAFIERVDAVGLQLWDREGDLREAAHEAYQTTVDYLADELDYDDEQAVELGKSFGRAVKQWIQEGSSDLDDLSDKLEERQAAWEEKQLSSF